MKAQRKSVSAYDAVLAALIELGPSTDETLVALYDPMSGRRGWPHQSSSSIRSRRAELARAGLAVPIGLRPSLRSGRQAVVWTALAWLERETRPVAS